MSDSDVVSFQDIPYFYAEGNGEKVIWDFSDNLSEDNKIRICLQKDTLDRYVVLSDHDITYFKLSNDTLFLVGEESPLSKIDYTMPQLAMHFPLEYGDSLSVPFKGYGVYCGDHPFREQGMSSVLGDAAGSIVIGEDTIQNVLRVYTLKSYSICMDIDSAALDTAKLKQVIEERYDWYARGYRYPIFTTITSTSYDNMQAIATGQKAWCMLPEVQELLSDQYNQDIRRNDSLTKAGQSIAESDIIHYTIRQDGGQIEISYSLDGPADIKALVADVMGITYRQAHQHRSSGDGCSLRLDCSGLRYGQYIIYMNVNGKVYSQNITLKP